jgi:hypothetical protein
MLKKLSFTTTVSKSEILTNYENIYSEYMDGLKNIINTNIVNIQSYDYNIKIRSIFKENKVILAKHFNRYYEFVIETDIKIIPGKNEEIEEPSSSNYYCPLQKYLSKKKIYFSNIPLLLNEMRNSKIILEEIDIDSLNYLFNGEVRVDESWNNRNGIMKISNDKVFCEYLINNMIYIFNKSNCDIFNFDYDDVRKVLSMEKFRDNFFIAINYWKHNKGIIEYLIEGVEDIPYYNENYVIDIFFD